MAGNEPPDKKDRGRPRKRRYFRRRRRKSSQDASLATEQGADDAQPAQKARPKSQNRRRSENRRRSSRRRNSAARAQENQVQHAVEESQPQGEVYIYTHVIRPTYREGIGGEFQADHSLNLSGVTASAPVGMDYLLESIERQLDDWFNPPADSTTEDNAGGEANMPSADSTDGGGVQEEEPGSVQEMADESRANDDVAASE